MQWGNNFIELETHNVEQLHEEGMMMRMETSNLIEAIMRMSRIMKMTMMIAMMIAAMPNASRGDLGNCRLAS